MKFAILAVALVFGQLAAVTAQADEYNQRSEQDYRREQAIAEQKEARDEEAKRVLNNTTLVRKALKLAGANARVLCYDGSGSYGTYMLDKKEDSAYRWVTTVIAGVHVQVAYEAESVDGSNCLDALFGIACPYIIAKQIEQSEKPLPAPFLEVCHVNSATKSCRVSNREETECH